MELPEAEGGAILLSLKQTLHFLRFLQGEGGLWWVEEGRCTKFFKTVSLTHAEYILKN